MKRFVIEFGMGVDFHGQDATNAAVKAVKDAISRSCMIGLKEILEIEDLDSAIETQVTIASTDPQAIDLAAIEACLPVGGATLKAVEGGLAVPGLFVPELGDRDNSIIVALAALEVVVLPREQHS